MKNKVFLIDLDEVDKRGVMDSFDDLEFFLFLLEVGEVIGLE